MRRNFSFAACAALVCITSGGCGSSTLSVYGTLMQKGAPYKLPEGQRLSLTFYAMDVKQSSGNPSTSEEPYAATFNPTDSTFTVPGPDGYGIPPGKYRVCVVQKWKRESLPAAKPNDRKIFDRDTDLLFNRYSPGFSPVTREITSSGNLELDLDKLN